MKRHWLAAILFFIISLPASAQPGGPPDDPDQPVPIHGLAYLLAAGAALGFTKLFGKKTTKS